MAQAGFAGDDCPRADFRSVVGRLRNSVHGELSIGQYLRVYCNTNMRPDPVGDDAWRARGVMKLAYPIERGIVTDWDDMEK